MTLDQLNRLDIRAAEKVLRQCCGSRMWAQKMAAHRPFADLETMYRRSREICATLAEADWLEAFAAHPQIGDIASGDDSPRRSDAWSAAEQAGMRGAPDDVRRALAEGNLRYRQKFGFIFLICATEKSAREILESLQQRLPHDRATELRIAAGEQQRITELRLKKLCAQPATE